MLATQIRLLNRSQADVARAIGMDPSNFSRMMRGRLRLTPEQAVRTAEVLNLDANALLLASVRDTLPRAMRPEPLPSDYEVAFRHQLARVDYQIQTVRVSMEVHWDGAVAMECALEDCEPIDGREAIRELVLEEVAHGSGTADTYTTEMTSTVDAAWRANRSGSLRLYVISFPREPGWVVAAGATPKLTLRTKTTTSNALHFPDGDGEPAAWGHRSSHHIQTLVMKLRFPDGYEPQEWYPVKAIGPNRRRADSREYPIWPSILDRGVCADYEFHVKGGEATLTVHRPLIGIAFYMGWHSGSAARFAELKREHGGPEA